MGIRNPGLNRPPLLSGARLNGKSYRINLMLPLFISPCSEAGWNRSCDLLEKCEGGECIVSGVIVDSSTFASTVEVSFIQRSNGLD